MKQQFVITHQYTVLQKKEKTSQILNTITLKQAMSLCKYKEQQLLHGHNILTEGVFVTELTV
jgi:hypothetical protein